MSIRKPTKKPVQEQLEPIEVGDQVRITDPGEGWDGYWHKDDHDYEVRYIDSEHVLVGDKDGIGRWVSRSRGVVLSPRYKKRNAFRKQLQELMDE